MIDLKKNFNPADFGFKKTDYNKYYNQLNGYGVYYDPILKIYLLMGKTKEGEIGGGWLYKGKIKTNLDFILILFEKLDFLINKNHKK